MISFFCVHGESIAIWSICLWQGHAESLVACDLVHDHCVFL